MDIVFLVVMIGFFVVMAGLTQFCDALMKV
jgi:hypothetical protein